MITIDPPIEQMTLAERYDLLARINETLPQPDLGFSEFQMQLLRERQRAADAGENMTFDYHTAMARLRTKSE